MGIQMTQNSRHVSQQSQHDKDIQLTQKSAHDKDI